MCMLSFITLLKCVYWLINCVTTDCKDPKALGMVNGKIQDSQITASSEWDPYHGPTNGRLKFRARGRRTGAWSAKINNANQWLQVDFRQQTTVLEISTQGRGNCGCNQWVKTYTVSYSNDGRNFHSYKQNGRIKVRNAIKAT